jgi:transposase
MRTVRTLDEVKRDYVMLTMLRCGGNIVHAAKALQVSQSTVRRTMGRWESWEQVRQIRKIRRRAEVRVPFVRQDAGLNGAKSVA